LSLGERKSLQTDRVILVRGPEEEVSVVRRIYLEFLEKGKPEQEIADELNAEGVRTDLGRQWTRGTIHRVLTSEKYVGNNVYNHISYKLKQRRVKNTPDMWIRCDGAYEAIVPETWFLRVKELVAARYRGIDDDSMLNLLRSLYERVGRLSGLLIDEQDNMPSSGTYRARFGGLSRAYSLAGFRSVRDLRYVEVNRKLKSLRPEVVSDIVRRLERTGASVCPDLATGFLRINDQYEISIVITRCLVLASGMLRWFLRFDARSIPDVIVIVRMASNQQEILDYYLFPCIDLPIRSLRVREEENAFAVDAYRFDDLRILDALSERFELSKLA
jgi:hypothetical protein